MYDQGYPTTTFTPYDNSGASTAVLYSANTDGCFVPFQFIMAERGTPGEIYFGGAKELNPLLGISTFDESGPYYSPATRFLATGMAGAGCNAMRLVDPAATAARLGLFMKVTQTNIPQYQKASDGTRTVDSDGNFIPATEVDGVTALTAPGVIVKWIVRALTSEEVSGTLVAVDTAASGGAPAYITYPIMDFTVSSVGIYGNKQGFSLSSTSLIDSTIAQSISSVLYRFVPMALPSGVSTTASPIVDNLGSYFNDVSFKNVAIYNQTGTNYAFQYVLGTSYVDAPSGNNLLPYDITVYGANIGIVGNLVIAATESLAGTDPYLIDLISGTNLSGLYYDYLEVDSASSTVVNSSVVNYCLGGTDGDTSFAKLQLLMQTWLSGTDTGEFPNVQQHPMTHYCDPGVDMDTKLLLFNMLDMRDNLKIDVSTQDVSAAPNTEAQDISAAATLLTRAQMHPESTITGVPCHRVGIYAHASTLINGTPYSGLVPFNLNRLIQRRNLDGGVFLKGSSGGRPNSEVTIFRKPNWVADSATIRATAWAACLNTVMHANRTTLFYPSLRTVYTNDTSLFSDDEVSDRVIYMYKICRTVWSIFAGVRRPPVKLYPQIQQAMDTAIAAMLGQDDLGVSATLFQTAVDANLGFSVSVNLNVDGDPALRQMNINVLLSRA